MSDDDHDAYEDDFDEQLRLEMRGHEENGHTEGEEEVEVMVEPIALETRLSMLGGELRAKLDATLRPNTGGGLRASVDLGSSSLFRPSIRPGTSGGGEALRQSQDMFASLDLAGTGHALDLKQQYDRFWDACVEEHEQEVTQGRKESVSATSGASAAAENKHLARLKSKIAASKEQSAAATAASTVSTKQERGWNDGFAFDRDAPIHARSPRARPAFERPSIVKASAALAQLMANTGTGPITAQPAPTLKKGPNNAKPLPPAPAVVDPARVRKMVQTHMPAIVLAKLAASRRPPPRHTAQAHPAVRKRSRVPSAKLSRRSSALMVAPSEQDEEDQFAEEISPASKLGSAKSRLSSAAPSRATSAKAQPAAASAAAPVRPQARASSAGVVKPTNSSMLLAAERAAQLHSASHPPDQKLVPIAQWTRMKKELEDLRRKVVALEAENELLRGQSTASASPPPSAPLAKPAHLRTTSVVPAIKPSTSSLSSTGSVVRSGSGSVKVAPATTAPSTKFGLKLNLDGLTPDGSPAPTQPSTAVPASAMATPAGLMSPRSRCAVNQCGAPRASGKPYCTAHLVAHQVGAPTPKTNAPIISPPSATPTIAATIAAAASAPAPASIQPALPASGISGALGLNLHLGGQVKQYNYDYESDDNYGGTDDEDSMDASLMSMDQSMTEDGAMSQRGTARANDGLTARQHTAAGTPRLNDGLTARQHDGSTSRQYDTSRQPEATPRQSTPSSARAPLPSPAATTVARVQSDSSARGPSGPSRPSTGHMLLSSSATPRLAQPSITRGLPVGGGAGGFDLESLRASPYAGIDDLNGSFEITQSGTFKRAGFSLNRQGMHSTPSGSSSSGDETRPNAFQWDAPTARGSTASSSRPPIPSPSPSTVVSPLASPNSFRALNVADLYMLGVLGRGSSGVVYRAFHAPTLTLLAIKSISIHEQDKRKQLTQELRTLTLAPNPYTIGFRGAYFDAQHIYLALEFMDGGSLDDLRESEGTVSEIELAFIFEQVLKGLKHLEKEGVIHRDIKPHNILFNESGAFKVTDFGIISDLRDRSDAQAMAEAKTFVGTLLYMSPERIEGKKYSFSCDIWSMALSLLTCRIGEFAIPHNSHWELVNAIQSGPAILEHYSEDQVSHTLRDLLAHCLATNPLERPTAEECLQHPFFSQFRSGAGGSIPMPAHFPPPRSKPAQAPTGLPMEGPSATADRRAARTEEVDRKNERHMLEQVCQLVATRGLTVRRPAASSTSPAPSALPSPPRPAPIDAQLCSRISDRIASLLRVQPANVRSTLIACHNRHVGFTP